MILKKMKIQNYKQFVDENEIIFNTNGKITVVYGFNGFGKTRLHTFFHWLMYGKDRDDETIYNKPKMDKIFTGDTCTVFGELEFEHNGVEYILMRSEDFKKNTSKIHSLGSVLKLRFLDENKNWRTLIQPERELTKILPYELSQYFFFDGEGMLSELLGKTNSKRLGTSLKDAVNTIFGLSLYENAIRDIVSGKSSVIYELSKQLKDASGKNSTSALVSYINNTTEDVEELGNQIGVYNEKITKLSDRNEELSSQIGKADNKAQYENSRRNNKKLIESYLKEIDTNIKNVGRYTTRNLSYVLVSNNITNSTKILSKKTQEKYVSGMTKDLIKGLLERDKCICGNEITTDERKQLTSLLDYLPPKSYKSVYLDYAKDAKNHLSKADLSLDLYSNTLSNIALRRAEIIDLEDMNREIDSKLESISHLAPLVNERKENENEISVLKRKVESTISDLASKKTFLSGAKQQLKDRTKNSKHNKIIQNKMDFMEEVKDLLEASYNKKRDEYKNILQENIKTLAGKMLSVNRDIELLDNYTLSVKDSSNNHILSEGQAAIITFSYIGGILNSLKEMDVEYVSNEYPLILDAPLSKLDQYHINKVFKHLPNFSNQLIIFSKEEIDELITEDDQDFVYQILSNKQANKALIGKYVGKKYFSNIEFRMVE